MKNPFKRTTRFAKSMFAVDRIKEDSQLIRNLAKDLTNKDKDQGADRDFILQLDDEQKQAITKRYTNIIKFFLLIWIASLIYLIFALIADKLLLSLEIFAFSLVLLAIVFRYHVALYQLRNGLKKFTIKEWMHNSFFRRNK